MQSRVAGRLGETVGDAFGVPARRAKPDQRPLFTQLTKEVAKSSTDASNIIDDLQAYYERRRMAKFKAVLDDMVKSDVTGNLRQLGDDLPKEVGLSMAQCEYWSDVFDRWAEDLVDPASGGA